MGTPFHFFFSLFVARDTLSVNSVLWTLSVQMGILKNLMGIFKKHVLTFVFIKLSIPELSND